VERGPNRVGILLGRSGDACDGYHGEGGDSQCN
jgi:hypothetical protein